MTRVSYDERVNAPMAMHPACPPAMLTHMAVEAGPRVRSIVASNLNCDRVALAKLSIDTNKEVAFNATSNPNWLPVHLLGPTRHRFQLEGHVHGETRSGHA